MSKLSIFDIAGPIMVGPSSSHTAGACKIGQFARALFHHKPTKVTFYLHGSFGEVFKGHATDRALLGGVMKFRTSDPRIKDSFEIAEEIGLEYQFIPKDLGADQHPNTVKVVLESPKHPTMEVIGSSIGGGMIEILKVDNFDVYLKGTAGKRLSLVVGHDCDDNICQTTQKAIEEFEGIRVAEITGTSYNKKRLTVYGLEGKRITKKQVQILEKKLKGVDFIRSLSRLQSE
jgi:iron-sulfur-dependent L-serine dehydratase beta subunit